MEKFYSVQMSASTRLAEDWKTGLSATGFRLGRIEKVLEPGRFVVLLESGVRVTAEGSRALKIESRVRVFPPREISSEVRTPKGSSVDLWNESGTYWAAFLPLGFGGQNASTHLQVFVEEKPEGFLNKSPRAVYFIVWIRTEKLGSLQWSIYLKGHEVSLRIFAEQGSVDRVGLKDLVVNVERSLKNKGFSFLAPTVYSERPFKVPEGFRLNVRG